MKTAAPPEPASTAQLLAWAADPASRNGFSPLEQPYLLFDTADANLGETELAAVRAWLRQLPCPSIGIAARHSPLAPACDVLVEQVGDAQVLIDNIRRSPIAAAVLAQLLRATEMMAIPEALTAESLAYSTLQAGPEFRRWLEANRVEVPVVASDAGPAVVLEREGETLRLELNRPSNHNAMSMEMRDGLVEALQLALGDDSIRRLRISGRGKCFSTGGDLSEFGTAPDPAIAHVVRSLALPGRLLATCAARTEVQVHGACLGSGIEFPAFAGQVLASGNAYFQLPELKFGLIPGAGGCVSIARRIGRQRTAWLVLSGKRINARQALEWGLVNALVSGRW
jgi:enoyl-CoA hydratase